MGVRSTCVTGLALEEFIAYGRKQTCEQCRRHRNDNTWGNIQSELIVGKNKMLNKRAPSLQASVSGDHSQTQTNSFQGRQCLEKQDNMGILGWERSRPSTLGMSNLCF